MRKWDAEPTLTLEGREEGGVGASEVGEGACFWISVGCGSGISTRRGFQQKQDTLWGRQGLTVKTVPQATDRLESSKGKSARHKAAVCRRHTTFPGYPVLSISHMFLLV